MLAALLAAPAFATTPTPITLDQAMSHPDWIGTPVEAAWWSWDGKQIFYKQKRVGSSLRDTFQAGDKPRLVTDSELSNQDSPNMVFNRERTRAIVLRNGDLFERDLKSGALLQISRGTANASTPHRSRSRRQRFAALPSRTLVLYSVAPIRHAHTAWPVPETSTTARDECRVPCRTSRSTWPRNPSG